MTQTTTNAEIRIGTLNVRRMMSVYKQQLVYNFMINGDFDVLCLQEVCFNEFNFDSINLGFVVNRLDDAGGTAIIYKRTIPLKNIKRSPNGRILSAEIGDMNLVNVYAPAGRLNCPERVQFFKNQLPRYLTGRNLVVVGDFNAIIHKYDRLEKGIQSGKRNQHLAALVEAHQLVDVWLENNEKGTGHTLIYPGGSSRIDQVYITSNSRNQVCGTELIRVPFSDHACIRMRLNTSSRASSKKRHSTELWKFNSAVLEEREYLETVSWFITSARRHPLWAKDRTTWWEDIFKQGLKKITIDYCRVRKEWKSATSRFFRTCLDEGAECARQSVGAHKLFRSIQRSVENWELNENRGVIIRSRSSSTIQGEVPSAYHIARERKSKQSTVISNIKGASGSIITKQEEIAKEFETYFAAQYAAPITGDERLDNHIATPRRVCNIDAPCE